LHRHYKMEASVPDLERTESQSSETSSMSSIVVVEPPNVPLGEPDVVEADSSPEDAFTNVEPELIPHVPGDTTTHSDGNGSPAPSTNGSPASYNSQAFPTPRFDPRALLNPKSAASKRPASSGGDDADRGRTDSTIAGQVALVERLHNVQERTASPAKRVKTEDQRKQNGNHSGFVGGSTLDIQNPNGQPRPPQPQQGPAIDLTMSKELGYSVSRYS
jgi:hypothetical protein